MTGERHFEAAAHRRSHNCGHNRLRALLQSLVLNLAVARQLLGVRRARARAQHRYVGARNEAVRLAAHNHDAFDLIVVLNAIDERLKIRAHLRIENIFL